MDRIACYCNNACSLKTGVSDGPNRGKSFYVCSNRKCEFTKHDSSIIAKYCVEHTGEMVDLQSIGISKSSGQKRLYYRCRVGRSKTSWCGYQALDACPDGSNGNHVPSSTPAGDAAVVEFVERHEVVRKREPTAVKTVVNRSDVESTPAVSLLGAATSNDMQLSEIIEQRLKLGETKTKVVAKSERMPEMQHCQNVEKGEKKVSKSGDAVQTVNGDAGIQEGAVAGNRQDVWQKHRESFIDLGSDDSSGGEEEDGGSGDGMPDHTHTNGNDNILAEKTKQLAGSKDVESREEVVNTTQQVVASDCSSISLLKPKVAPASTSTNSTVGSINLVSTSAVRPLAKPLILPLTATQKTGGASQVMKPGGASMVSGVGGDGKHHSVVLNGKAVNVMLVRGNNNPNPNHTQVEGSAPSSGARSQRMDDLQRQIIAQKRLYQSTKGGLPDGGARLYAHIRSLEQQLRAITIVDGAKNTNAPAAAAAIPHTAQSAWLQPKQQPGHNSSATTQNTKITQFTKPIAPPSVTAAQTHYDQQQQMMLYGGRMTASRLQQVTQVTRDAMKRLHKSLESMPKESDAECDPPGLRVSLLPHQRQGLAWLSWRELQEPAGGILADDMGLGKTLSMISLTVIWHCSTLQ